jgi:hypothetical protein
MGKTKRIILIISMIICLVIVLFPPWRQVTDVKTNDNYYHSSYRSIPIGISFILTPPAMWQNNFPDNTSIYIDYKQLFMELIILVLLSGGALFIFDQRKNPGENAE